MAQKKSYSRYFIILQEDEKGYSLASDKIASGYAKLETKNDKCKVSYYVQNLKKDKTPYYMILICNKNDAKKIINVGEMNIDDYGRADVSYEYPINNVSGSGIGIDKVSGAAIVRLLDGNIIAVMSGFASMDIPDWQSFDVSENKNKKAEGQKPKPVKQSDKKTDNKDNSGVKKEVEKAKDTKKDKNAKDDKDTNKKTVKDNKKDDKKDSQKDKAKLSNNKSIFDEYEENIELKKKEINPEKMDNIKDDKPKQRLDKESSLSNKISDLVEDEKMEKLQEIKNINEDESNDDKIYIDNSAVKVSQKNYRGHNKKSKHDFFGLLVKGFKEVSDVTGELKRCKWYKVPATSINSLQNTRDHNKYTFVYCPMMPYYKYIEENCHILFGYKYDKNGNVKYMLYGIPGTKSREDQPYEGRSGFVTWVPSYRGKDKSGYWIMFYDFKTGTIQIPIKKK
ncbi:hypothetical protein KM803_03275 [Clostridium tyrobutyricum]|uniref:DUF7922 domain-containing protein n=1 Tax=Clostridium tyrobutyricum TaxID=1519 RepID=UPI0002D6F38E|nr:hypothetical protein [Clostridium tyrobutyricum]MBV4416335.1 hypothetical protein [Clostridium tyrobutyricum]MBV4421453.1 hypothetical protein [Clostridium tyrobutyricum]MBV4424599.1 hypothetical protein [Clostridium tyrobutyricum]MBV4430356.1 hypothetical protein [Clostridium tyrobutyricum]MBV4436534.1 hypothetical protein [Clostridium tyrobutyricum]